jgi:6-phosphogluconolactonase
VKIPRGFAIDPAGKWLLAAGQDDNKLVTFAIDAQSGKLKPTEATATVGKPVCILFLK